MTRTVIIPAYKAGWCLNECMEAIGVQTVRPNRILIGCDQCPESAAKALKLKTEFAKTSRKHHRIITDVYWFPNRVGPYRVRNTLALMAQTDILHFFDADDLMAPNYIEMMESELKECRFLWPLVIMQDMRDGHTEQWTRGHGLITIYKHTFAAHGGFEPWTCGADTEAHQRWEQGGLQRCTTKVDIATVRKHEQGLTIDEATGYKSDVRVAVKKEMQRRRKYPVRCASIGVASCWQINSMDDIDNKHAELPALPYPDANPKAQEASKPKEKTEALQHIRNLLAMTDPWFDRHAKKVISKAAAYLEQHKAR